jgi:hypothetical protein
MIILENMGAGTYIRHTSCVHTNHIHTCIGAGTGGKHVGRGREGGREGGREDGREAKAVLIVIINIITHNTLACAGTYGVPPTCAG